MFGFPFVFIVIQLILITFVFPYDTPKQLKQTGQTEKLREVMSKIYSRDEVEKKIDEILIENTTEVASPSYKETFLSPKYQMATFVGCMLSVFQQLSGINAIMFYSTEIFKRTGYNARLATGFVGFVNMITTLISSVLLTCKFFVIEI